MLFNYDVKSKQKNIIIRNLLLARGYDRKFISNYFKPNTLVLTNGSSRMYFPKGYYNYDKKIFIERFSNPKIKCLGYFGNNNYINNGEVFYDKFIQVFNIHNKVVRIEYDVSENFYGYIVRFFVTYYEIDIEDIYQAKITDFLDDYYKIPYPVCTEYVVPIKQIYASYIDDVNYLVFERYSDDIISAFNEAYKKVEELLNVKLENKICKKRIRKITD